MSSDKQTVENQRFEINKFCEKRNIVIDDWIEETISGTKNYIKRQLGNLLKYDIICSSPHTYFVASFWEQTPQ